MLTLQRVPTIVSINQTSSGDAISSLPGATLPVYRYAKADTRQIIPEDVFGSNVNSPPCSPPEEKPTRLDEIIQHEWQEREKKNLFRYNVAECESKLLQGPSGYIAQLNEGRHSKKRPTEFRVDEVLQPYDPKKFNFTKVDSEEILFAFEEKSNDVDSESYLENGPTGESPNIVVINVSPIEYGHILLVPKVKSQIPQRIDPENLVVALHMAVEVNNPCFRLGYNSFGAFASINHLHFQAYYLDAQFPIERAETTRIFESEKKGGYRISEVVKYPVRTLVYEAGDSLKELADVVGEACIRLQNSNIPFNILISDCGTRVFLIPQCYAEKQARGEVEQELLDTQVNPAVWEISGHIVLKRRKDYNIATEEFAEKFLAEVSLSESRFSEVKKMCKNVAERVEVASGLKETAYRGGLDLEIVL
ncbi:hypothetical protein R1sor_019823 [Riccia sorocarpa]|uniref:GDP-D-glucose phosphorylase 1 n=1 Tax=Riccia sorocarpa TaxID=122646 RepID=A0ABD3IHT3_9MARC